MAADRDRPATLPERGGALLDEATERTALSLRARLMRLREHALVIAQAATAAALAWLVATEGLGHERPFFAPVAAIISLGMTLGRRGRRAVELVVGVAVGILVGDLIVLAIGSGAWQLGVVVLLAMTVAVLLGSSPVLATQAAVSAALVVTLQPPGTGMAADRFVDALVGGGVGLAISSLVLPGDPLARVRAAAKPVLAELAGVLGDVAAALEARDREAAAAALLRARAIDAEEARFRETVDAGVELTRTAPPRRGRRAHLELYAIAAAQLDHAVRNTRVLARGAIRAIELEDHVPPGVPAAMRDLAEAVRLLELELDDPTREVAARDAALRAAARASAVLEDTANLSVSVLVGQVRSTATDLLRGMGWDAAEARTAVRAAGTR